MKEQHDTKRTMAAWYDFRIKIIAEGAAVGLLAGILVVAYRFLSERALNFTLHIYALERQDYRLIPLWSVFLALAGLIAGIMVKKVPLASGSGIPQIKGMLMHNISMDWWKVIISKFIGGIISIAAGLSLGREGPSIQIGASVGQGFARFLKKVKIEEKFLITGGASAGLAAAFNAPLAGVIFALEELHKNFSPLVMICALTASIAADFISKEFFGMSPVFNFRGIVPIPLNLYFFLIILGVIVGLAGIAFNKSLILFQELFKKVKCPPEVKPVIPFLLAGVLGLVLPEVLGGGHGLVGALTANNFGIRMLFILLIVKFFFTMISYGSSVPGGIFLPLLVIGAIIGDIYSKVLMGLTGNTGAYAVNFIILAMAAYFTAIVRAPITGIVLITEMTGSFSHLLSVGIVCLTSYLVVDLLHSKPIYDLLLERLLGSKSMEQGSESRDKLIIEVPVHMDSVLEGKQIKDIEWPPHCLIVGIKREGGEIIPNGESYIHMGDYLIIITNADTAANVRDCLGAASG